MKNEGGDKGWTRSAGEMFIGTPSVTLALGAKVCLFAENESQKGVRDRQQRVSMTAKTLWPPSGVVIKS